MTAVDFVLNGHDFTTINAGTGIGSSDPVSFRVVCQGQSEVDHYWSALVDGRSEGRCDWLKDRFGVSGQVTPVEMGSYLVPRTSYLGYADPDTARRAMSAMTGMTKIDLAVFRAALEDEWFPAPPGTPERTRGQFCSNPSITIPSIEETSVSLSSA